MERPSGKKAAIQDYYAKLLAGKRDLQTRACCSPDVFPPHLQAIMGKIHPEILEKFYGCGSPIPPALENCTVLDLGCGSGRDVYAVSALAGPGGRVLGVDMTAAQIMVAERHLDFQTKQFGLSRTNVEFKQGYMENLQELGIADNSVDVVISNCVINLSPDKRAVFAEIFRVLKPGGELYFSDIFAASRVPPYLQEDPILLGECLGGALYVEDFRRLLRDLGCLDYRVVSKRRVVLDNPAIEARVGLVDFYAMTVRVFKLQSLEDLCEDYGQVATYLGTIPECPHRFELDDHHLFKTGKPMLVCGNTASMVAETRYGRYFKVAGNRSRHYGPFACGPAATKADEGGSPEPCSCG